MPPLTFYVLRRVCRHTISTVVHVTIRQMEKRVAPHLLFNSILFIELSLHAQIVRVLQTEVPAASLPAII